MAARSAAAGGGGSGSSQSPHFFKVFFPELSGQILSIPPAFGSSLKSDAPGTAALRGPSGNVWYMDLAVVNSNALCFCNGWKAFVADHSVVAGDLLIFRYDGKLQFTVLLFDATACEKRCGFSALPCRDAVAAAEGCRPEGIHLPDPEKNKKRKKKREKGGDLELEASPRKKKKRIVKDELQFSPEKKKRKKKREKDDDLELEASQRKKKRRRVKDELQFSPENKKRKKKKKHLSSDEVCTEDIAFVESPEQTMHLHCLKKKKKKREKDDALGLQGSPETNKKHSSLGEISTEGSRLDDDDDSTKKSKSSPDSSLQKKQSACCCCHASIERTISSPDRVSASVCTNPHLGALGMIECPVTPIEQRDQAYTPFSYNEPQRVPLRVERGPREGFVLLPPLKGKACRSSNLKFQRKQETLKVESCSEKPEKTRSAPGAFKIPPDYRTLVESRQACHHGEDTVEELRAGSLISQRRPVTEKEVDETLERAKSFESNNPWTTIVMRGGYVYAGLLLHIPALFAREHLPNETSMITLWDSNGKSWPVKCFADGRGARFSAGWAKFAYAHNLEQHDVCLFELIGRFQLKVHIYRVVEEITPLLRVSGRRG